MAAKSCVDADAAKDFFAVHQALAAPAQKAFWDAVEMFQFDRPVPGG